MGTKISPSAAVVWDAICQARQTDTYHMLQYFIYTMIKAAADPHGINPDVQKILTMLDTDVGWQKAFNLCAPNVKTKVAQVVLILEQEGKEGFGAVMIDKPFMGKAPEKVDDIDPDRSNPQMTENVDYILERVCEVTMQGIYRRLRMLGAQMECNNLSDVLLTLIEKQSNEEIDAENQREMQGSDRFTDYGKEYAYGKKTKSIQHKGIEDYDKQQPIRFSPSDTPDLPELNDNNNNEPNADFRPFDQEW
jgi:hypothetical protein